MRDIHDKEVLKLSEDASIVLGNINKDEGTCDVLFVVDEFCLSVHKNLGLESARGLAYSFRRHSDYIYIGSDVDGADLQMCYDIYNEVWASRREDESPLSALSGVNMGIPTIVANSYYTSMCWMSEGRVVVHNSRVGTTVNGLGTNKSIRELLYGDLPDMDMGHAGIVFASGDVYWRCINNKFWQNIGDYTVDLNSGVVSADICGRPVVSEKKSIAHDCISSFLSQSYSMGYFGDNEFDSVEMFSDEPDVDYIVVLSVGGDLMDLKVYKDGEAELFEKDVF